MYQPRVAIHERNDVHNASVDAVIAQAGLCGFTHLPSGSTCVLCERHAGTCRFVPGREAHVSVRAVSDRF